MQFLGNNNRILVLDLAEWQYSPALDLCDDGDPPAPVIHGGIQKLIGRDDEPSLRSIPRFIRPSPAIHGPLEYFDGGAFLGLPGLDNHPAGITHLPLNVSGALCNAWNEMLRSTFSSAPFANGGAQPAAPRIAMRGRAIIILDLFTMHTIG